MNRYLLGAILGLIGVLTIYGIGNSRDAIRQATDDARRSVSATPTAAAEGLTPIESAGQNVTRQTSAEGLARPTTTETDSVPPQAAPPATPAVEPSPAPAPAPAPLPADQDAIPALW